MSHFEEVTCDEKLTELPELFFNEEFTGPIHHQYRHSSMTLYNSSFDEVIIEIMLKYHHIPNLTR